MNSFTKTLIPSPLIQTTTMQEALQKTWHAIHQGSIIAFDGDTGLGKTTTAAYVCRETSSAVVWS